MSGLNVLLWTIAVILILGAVATVGVFIAAYVIRKKQIEKFGREPTLMDRLKEAQAAQEELMRKHTTNDYETERIAERQRKAP